MLRERRLDLRLSQEELSFRSGVHRNYIGGIERGERNPSLLAVLRLAEALEIAPERLFDRRNQAVPSR